MSKFLTVRDYQKWCEENVSKMIYDYYASGADDQTTLHDNCYDYSRIKLVPRVMKDVSSINMKTNVLGFDLDFPVMIAATAMQRMATSEGEIATAKAAKQLNTIYTMSSLSTTSMEDISKIEGFHIFQLYILKNRDITIEIVKNAERLGFKALVLTVDTPILGRRLSDEKNGFTLPNGLQLKIYQKYMEEKSKLNDNNSKSGLSSFVNSQFDDSLTWKDVSWLKSITKLPVLVKGVVSPKDAVLAVQAGVDGIIVSNHGARQLDFSISTISALPGVVKAVENKVPVFLDGGIRRGTDVLKALALGAKAVFVGRPVLYGLCHSGSEGVVKVMNILKDELKRSMVLSGCANLSEITSDIIYNPKSSL